MKRIRLTLLGLLAFAGLAIMPAQAAADCVPGNCWGAVAYGPGGAWAYAVDFGTRGSASRAAQGRCGGRCTHVLSFHNSCGAYATGPYGYGWGNAGTRYAAEVRAIQECNARSPGCAVRVWGCTTR